MTAEATCGVVHDSEKAQEFLQLYSSTRNHNTNFLEQCILREDALAGTGS